MPPAAVLTLLALVLTSTGPLRAAAATPLDPQTSPLAPSEVRQPAAARGAGAADPSTSNRLVRAEPSPQPSTPIRGTHESVYRHFGLERVEVLQWELLGNPLWKYVASAIYLVLAFYVSKLIDLFFHAWLKKWTRRTATPLIDLLVDLISGPVKVIVFVVLLHIGLDIFSWPAWFANYLSNGLKLVVAGSITYVALRFIDLLMGYWQSRMAADAEKSLNEQLYPVLRKSLKVFVVVVAALVTSQNLGVNITSLLASLSIGGLALGLAAQDTLSNLFGAVAIYIDKPFHLGDRIQLEGGVDGVVESIGLRSTRVRNLDGHLITVPNKTMGGATITNIARRPNIKTEMNIGLTYDTTPTRLQRALAILAEIYRPHPMTHDVWISFNTFADSALNILVLHWWKGTDYKTYLAGMQEFNLAIKQRFDQEGISFAFPSQTLYLKQDSQWRLTTGESEAAPR